MYFTPVPIKRRNTQIAQIILQFYGPVRSIRLSVSLDARITSHCCLLISNQLIDPNVG